MSVSARTTTVTDEDGHVAPTEVIVFVVHDARDTMLGRIDHDGLYLREERRQRGGT